MFVRVDSACFRLPILDGDGNQNSMISGNSYVHAEGRNGAIQFRLAEISPQEVRNPPTADR